MAETKSRGSITILLRSILYLVQSTGPKGRTFPCSPPTAGQTASSAVDKQLGAEVTRKNLSIQPTFKIPVGYRFNTRVNRDILFEAPYTPAEP
jgi:type IV secretory pathway VirB10-like protein